jgi:ATP-dependent helicase/nuclease subunit A
VETSLPVLAFSPRIGLGARWHNPANRDEEKDDLFQHAIRAERRVRELDESNRLLYVAMTRAGRRLILSFPANGVRLANWAAVVAEKLALADLETCRDEVLARTAPDGKPWRLRLLVAAGAPEPRPRDFAPPVEAAAYVPPPAVTDRQDGNATVTDLALFAACPRQYYLGRYLGFEGRPRKAEPAGDAPTLSASDLGSQVHAVLARTVLPAPDPEAVRLAGVFRQSPLGRLVVRASRVEREFDFLMAVEGLVVRGQIDLWFEEGGELAIVDYKTDAVTAAEARRRAQDYALQLRLYAMAVERLAGRAPSRAWLYFLRPNTPVEVDLAPSLLDSPEQAVRDFQQAQSTPDFPLRAGERCHRCPFFHDLCPAVA